MYSNFVRIHQTLRVTPAMAAGVSEKVWEIADIVKLVEQREHLRHSQHRRRILHSNYVQNPHLLPIP